jgi:hypothetical protein
MDDRYTVVDDVAMDDANERMTAYQTRAADSPKSSISPAGLSP